MRTKHFFVLALATLSLGSTFTLVSAQTFADLDHIVKAHICPADLSKYAVPTPQEDCPENYSKQCGSFETACFARHKSCLDQYDKHLYSVLHYNQHMDRCDSMYGPNRVPHPSPRPTPIARTSVPPVGRSPSVQSTPIPTNRPDQLILSIRSNHKYVAQASLYSKNRNIEWPGNGKAYTLDDSAQHTYVINCEPGEKICYGAWDRAHSNVHWGNGHDGDIACDNCCAICGSGTLTANLGDASNLVDNDSGGSSNVIGDMFNAYVAGNARTLSRSSNSVHTSRPTPTPTQRSGGSRDTCPPVCTAQ